MSGPLQLAHRLRRLALRVLRWPTRGVKVMVFDPAGALLLVRHGYGRSDLWMLPGGGIARQETPSAAAAREIYEETGCSIWAVEAIGTYRASAEGRRDTVHLFRATTSDHPQADGREVIEARFFPLDAPPATLSAATARRIAELRGGARSAVW